MEVLIAVVILGTVAAIVVPRCLVSTTDAKEVACFHNKAVINSQVERWYFEKGSWPQDDLSDIGSDSDYCPEGIPICPLKPGKPYKLNGRHRSVGHEH